METFALSLWLRAFFNGKGDFMLQDLDQIDAFGVRKDGGADLVIFAPGPLKDSPETRTLLVDKVERYLSYINSPDFRAECPQAGRENTCILLRLDREPPAGLRTLEEEMDRWTAEYGARFAIRVQP